MVDIRDVRGCLLCRGDAATGLIDLVYKQRKVQLHLDIDAYIIVERDDLVTKITRVSTQSFRVSCY